jgi:hypothetical protein
MEGTRYYYDDECSFPIKYLPIITVFIGISKHGETRLASFCIKIFKSVTAWCVFSPPLLWVHANKQAAAGCSHLPNHETPFACVCVCVCKEVENAHVPTGQVCFETCRWFPKNTCKIYTCFIRPREISQTDKSTCTSSCKQKERQNIKQKKTRIPLPLTCLLS